MLYCTSFSAVGVGFRLLLIEGLLQKEFPLARAAIIGLDLIADIHFFPGDELVEVLDLRLNAQDFGIFRAVLVHGVGIFGALSVVCCLRMS